MHDCLSQFRRASHRRVLAEVRLDSGDGGILDVLRRRKMGLARAEVHHVNALLAELVSFGDDCHGSRGFDAVDSLSKFHCQRCFRYWCHARFPVLDFLAFCSLRAGSNFSFNLRSTISGTRSSIDPPSCATSRTRRELR